MFSRFAERLRLKEGTKSATPSETDSFSSYLDYVTEIKDPARSSSELQAYKALKCVVTDPEDGTSLHWDQASLTRWQLERAAPQCDQLCEKCLQLGTDISRILKREEQRPDTQWWEDPQDSFKTDHHNTIGRLRSAATAGCHFCALISHFKSEKVQDLFDCPDSSHYYLRVVYHQVQISRDWGKGLIEGLSRGFQVDIVTNEGEYNAAQLSAGVLNHGAYGRCEIPVTLSFSSTQCPKVLDLARRWLDKCMTTHDLCCISTTSSRPKWSPKRLIQISTSGDSIHSARLVARSTLPESKGYLTLSHRWGGANVVKLTKDSLHSFMIDMPLETLPKTFFDAILVTHHLGFEYLWIDSLCIIQDSEDDWLQESKSMGKVYRHSQCTIAAVKGQDSDSGLFAERNFLALTKCQLVGSQRGDSPVYAENELHRVTSEPLYKRGWVLQERCLSRRILEFGQKEISWKCIAGSASETRPFLSKKELGRGTHFQLNRKLEEILNPQELAEQFLGKWPHPRILAGQFKALLNDIRPTDHDPWFYGWQNLVWDYTDCQLTYVADREAAICGLINLISETLGVPFVHGMVVPYLVYDLIWCVYSPVKERIAIDAPSWSWFSVDTKVQNIYSELEMRHELRRLSGLDMAIVSVDDSVSVQRSGIPSRILRITAHMLEVRMSNPMTESIYTSYPFRLRDGRKQEKVWDDLEDLEACWDDEWDPDTTLDPTWKLMALQCLEGAEQAIWGKKTGYRLSIGLMIVAVDEGARLYKRVGSYNLRWHVGRRKHGFEFSTQYKLADSWKKRKGRRWLGERQTIWLA
ncbi:hypothetical protein E8E13_004875 [Curvularia kusanoi]|uniref:Heterokaryon incompatibility domain-containing protein n=1 Tax=Curvularia kusanoi TaxID=90978 RepID=A0A9P4TKQ7_CURKU|nr:hypothetical protein E8E13_004875 [Curvularia kusanoi]